MKQLKLMIIVGILFLLTIGCAPNQMQKEQTLMPQEDVQNSKDTAAQAQNTAVSDEKDIQNANDDFSQIESALDVY